jgi:hypothetical protein
MLAPAGDTSYDTIVSGYEASECIFDELAETWKTVW